MESEFTNLPDNARIWIFPSQRKFHRELRLSVAEEVEGFLNSWNSSQTKLIAAFTIKHDRFIIIGLHPDSPDPDLEALNDLSTFIMNMERTFDTTLMDRLNVCFKQGDFVQYKDTASFKKLIKSKSVSEKTTVFDNLIETKGELNYDWEVNIMETWMSRLFK